MLAASTAVTPVDPQVQSFMEENLIGGQEDTMARSFDPYMEQFGGTSANQAANTSMGQNFNRLVTLGQQNPELTSLSYDSIRSSIEGMDKMTAANYLEDVAKQWQNKGYNISPYTTQNWVSSMQDMATYNVGAADVLGTTVEAQQVRAGLRPSVYEQEQKSSLLDKSKEAMDAISKGYQAWAGMQGTPSGGGTAPSWVTSVPAGDTLLGKAGGITGSGGTFIGTPEQGQYQRNLVAAIRQQEEMAKQRAQAGWGVA